MSTNCLVTKLKSVVNNPSLYKYGEMRVNVSHSNTTNTADITLGLKSSEKMVVSIIGSGTIDTEFFSETYDGTNYGTHLRTLVIEPQAAVKNLYFSHNTDYKVSITGKYGLIVISNGGYKNGIFTLDTKEIKYSNSLENASVKLSGDIENISGLTSLRNILVASKDAYGNIASLASNNKFTTLIAEEEASFEGTIDDAFVNSPLTTVNIINCPGIKGTIDFIGTKNLGNYSQLYRSGLSGTVEGFVAARVAAGATSETNGITFTQILVMGTFGGTKYNDNAGGIITWNGTSKIIVYTHGDNPTIATHVYAKGATAEEIAAWEQAGKTVTVVE